MKQSIKRYISFISYRAIWGWIETFNEEFIQLYREKGRIDGSPEFLFSLCQDNPMRKDKELLWPFQTALLLMCPGVLEESVEYKGVKGNVAPRHPTVVCNSF